MIAVLVDRALRKFEWRATLPTTMKRAARLMEKVLERGSDAAVLRT